MGQVISLIWLMMMTAVTMTRATLDNRQNTNTPVTLLREEKVAITNDGKRVGTSPKSPNVTNHTNRRDERNHHNRTDPELVVIARRMRNFNTQQMNATNCKPH